MKSPFGRRQLKPSLPSHGTRSDIDGAPPSLEVDFRRSTLLKGAVCAVKYIYADVGILEQLPQPLERIGKASTLFETLSVDPRSTQKGDKTVVIESSVHSHKPVRKTAETRQLVREVMIWDTAF